ncbi:uncharacterized protein LOC115598293 [Calypte anna]|uniref:uncharacterized protein LOC115598293 n=1 Tax=Calypte anna TaxID=9244 RepID=UPI0011C3D57C|nr:uncharacterized protein LOC115598293 [Calypte anna]
MTKVTTTGLLHRGENGLFGSADPIAVRPPYWERQGSPSPGLCPSPSRSSTAVAPSHPSGTAEARLRRKLSASTQPPPPACGSGSLGSPGAGRVSRLSSSHLPAFGLHVHSCSFIYLYFPTLPFKSDSQADPAAGGTHPSAGPPERRTVRMKEEVNPEMHINYQKAAKRSFKSPHFLNWMRNLVYRCVCCSYSSGSHWVKKEAKGNMQNSNRQSISRRTVTASDCRVSSDMPCPLRSRSRSLAEVGGSVAPLPAIGCRLALAGGTAAR